MEAVLYQILNQPLDPALMVNAGVPPQVRALVLRCVEKNPANRPHGFREVVSELRGFMAVESSGSTRAIKTQPLPMPPPPVVAPQPKPRSVAIWLVMGAVVIGIAAGALWWTTRIKPQPIVPVVPVGDKTPPVVKGMVYIAAGTFLLAKRTSLLKPVRFTSTKPKSPIPTSPTFAAPLDALLRPVHRIFLSCM